MPAFTPEEIEGRSFSTARLGYSKREVDAFLHALATDARASLISQGGGTRRPTRGGPADQQWPSSHWPAGGGEGEPVGDPGPRGLLDEQRRVVESLHDSARRACDAALLDAGGALDRLRQWRRVVDRLQACLDLMSAAEALVADGGETGPREAAAGFEDWARRAVDLVAGEVADLDSPPDAPDGLTPEVAVRDLAVLLAAAGGHGPGEPAGIAGGGDRPVRLRPLTASHHGTERW